MKLYPPAGRLKNGTAKRDYAGKILGGTILHSKRSSSGELLKLAITDKDNGLQARFLLPFLISILFFCAFAPNPAVADGMILTVYKDRWDFSDEKSQQAIINYQNGIQKMIIAVGYNQIQKDQKAVWIFPVPADPSQIRLDIISAFPDWRGEEIYAVANKNLDNIWAWHCLTQLWSVPFYFSTSMETQGLVDIKVFGFGYSSMPQREVNVIEHLEKEGIVSELVTARTAKGLYEYLKAKGLNVAPGALPVFDHYIGNQYSFVVSWINPSETLLSRQDAEKLLFRHLNQNIWPASFSKFIDDLKQKYAAFGLAGNDRNFLASSEGRPIKDEVVWAIPKNPSLINSKLAPVQQKGISVTFPTKEIYFPLLPTSVYGKKIVPATIRVMGLVSPKIFESIKGYVETKYYQKDSHDLAKDILSFPRISKRDYYTKIDINAPSNSFVDDLWMQNQAPQEIYSALFVIKHQGIIGIVLFIILSMATSIFSGWFVFPDMRKHKLKLALLGLLNFTTIYGVIIATVLMRTKNQCPEEKLMLEKLSQKINPRRITVGTLLILPWLPFLLFGIFILFVTHVDPPKDLWFILICYIFPILGIVGGLALRRVGKENKQLIAQFKMMKYSTWSLQPKDKMKIIFVPFFSIFFLLLSLLIIDFLKYAI